MLRRGGFAAFAAATAVRGSVRAPTSVVAARAGGMLQQLQPMGPLRVLRLLSMAARARGAQPLQIFYGTQTGTARGFAEQLAEEAASTGVDCKVVDLKEFKPEILKPGTNAAFLVACYGAGEPTDNAKSFYTWLMDERRPTGLLKDVNFAVFGLGSKATHCDRFCVVGINVDRRFEELGANRIFPRVDGDDSDCIEIQFDDWQRGFLEKFKNEPSRATPVAASAGPACAVKPTAAAATAPAPATTATTTSTSATSTTSTTTTTAAPAAAAAVASIRLEAAKADSPTFQAGSRLFHYRTMRPAYYHEKTHSLAILRNREVTPDAGRSTKEMTISVNPRIPGVHPLRYTTGDHLVVYPTNPPQEVSQLLERLDLSGVPGQSPDQLLSIVRLKPSSPCPVLPEAPTVTLRQALAHIVDIRAPPTPKVLRSLAELAADPADRQRLTLWASDKDVYRREIIDAPRHLLDLLKECPSIRLTAERLLDLQPSLHPRYYSISSSSMKSPTEISITYRVLDYYTKHSNEHRFGVCTRFLADQPVCQQTAAPMEQQLEGFLPCHVWASDFKLPVDPGTPILMVAGGTGIAPFKAFMEERIFLKTANPDLQLGPAVLFYGVRNPSELGYDALLQKALATGALTALHTCYSDSIDGKPGVFLSDGLISSTKEIHGLISQGAYVYVCGGAKGFGTSIAAAFKRVFAQEEQLSAGQADAKFTSWMNTGFYLEDLS